MFLADLHMHSTFSDGKLTIPQLVDLYGRAGFGAISITDHLCEEQTSIGRAARLIGNTLTRDTFNLYLRILKSEANRAWRQYRMLLIPGFELTKNTVRNSRSAHILGIGIKDFIGADADPLTLARQIRAQGGLAIAAHPVSTRKLEKQTYLLWSQRKELASEFDAWEVASGPHLFDEVYQSGLPMVASSDLHHPKQFSSWKTVFYCDQDPEAVLQAVRDQELGFVFLEAQKHQQYRILRERSVLDERRNYFNVGHLGAGGLRHSVGKFIDPQAYPYIKRQLWR